jgi:protein-tyrosine phosphatase
MIRRLLSLVKAKKPVRTGNYTDHHCHILPGVDDGAKTIEESLEMARALSALGFTTVHCTPHCMPGYSELKPETVREHTASLQSKLDEEGIALRVLPGMEYLVTEGFAKFIPDLLPLGDTGMVLVETERHLHQDFLVDMLYKIKLKGHTPLIAHPERTPKVIRDERLFEKITRMGCEFQINLASFSGLYGSDAKALSRKILKDYGAPVIGSDGHNPHQIQKYVSEGMDTWLLGQESWEQGEN